MKAYDFFKKVSEREAQEREEKKKKEEEKKAKAEETSKRRARSGGGGGTIYDCERCGLFKGAKTPKMKPHGKFKKELVVWGEGPGGKEDEEGYQFVGKSGDLIRRVLSPFDIDIDEDCVKVNAVDCRPPDNRTPTDLEMHCCYKRKMRMLSKLQPHAILLLGEQAVTSFYKFHPAYRGGLGVGLAGLRGKAIPDRVFNAWVCFSYHPAYLLRGNEHMMHIFEGDLETFATVAQRKLPTLTLPKEPVIVTKFKQAQRVLERFITEDLGPIVVDYESTSFRYYEGIHEVLVLGIKAVGESKGYIIPIDKEEEGERLWLPDEREEIVELVREVMSSKEVRKVAQNVSHEHRATNWCFGVRSAGWEFDTMLGARTLDESHKISSQKMQVYLTFGIPNYGLDDKIIGAGPKKRNRLNEMSLQDVGDYCNSDIHWCGKLYKRRVREIETKEMWPAYRLLHDGATALADMQDQGVRLDVEYVEELRGKWTRQFEKHKKTILDSDEVRKFEKQKERPLRLNKSIGRSDLMHIAFNILGLPESTTLDETYLGRHAKKHAIIKAELGMRKMNKLLSYLDNFLTYQVDGYLYPNFHLDVARSYRSSSSEPNFQNIPKRSDEAAIIRRCIVPREGNVFLEVDYSAMEVRILACWSKDKQLIKFILDDYDMHGYWACKLSGWSETDMQADGIFKKVRHMAKNGFVFPNFYGSYWESTAENMYNNLMVDQVKKGWPRFGEFEAHVKACEAEFWKMFGGVRERQMQAVKEYNRSGYMQMIGWGFRRHGYLSRNIIFNSHIQGPAFHCLLWDLAQINKTRKKEKWKTKMPGQIHDAILFDCDPSEKEKIMERTDDVMINKIRKENKWLIVPLATEWQEGKVSWADMTGVGEDEEE